MARHAKLRLQRELLDYQRSPDNQIYLAFNDEDISKVDALIVGPVNTPYQLGMFEFSLKFPDQYPTVPPKVYLMTTNHGQTRFNPNLYASGKVCLSILGTWTGSTGEQWSPAHGIASVLLSIQSLLSENPYENEPGFGKNEKYGTPQPSTSASVGTPASTEGDNDAGEDEDEDEDAYEDEDEDGSDSTGHDFEQVNPGTSSAPVNALSSEDDWEEVGKAETISGASQPNNPITAKTFTEHATAIAASNASMLATLCKNRSSKTEEERQKEMDHYRRKITHETIRISVCQRLEPLVEAFTPHPPQQRQLQESQDGDDMDQTSSCTPRSTYISSLHPGAEIFTDLVKRLFLLHYHSYLRICEKEWRLVKSDSLFDLMPFEGGNNAMRGRFDYVALMSRLQEIRARLQYEVELWQRLSADWINIETSTSFILKSQYTLIKESNCFDNVDVMLEDDNPYCWTIVIMGKPSTKYDGGIFRAKMVFHNDFPEIWPRTQFITPVYHCQITPDGIPSYRVVREGDIRDHIQAIAKLLEEEPTPDPSAHVNFEASRLYTGSEDERREYNRSARRSAARSVE